MPRTALHDAALAGDAAEVTKLIAASRAGRAQQATQGPASPAVMPRPARSREKDARIGITLLVRVDNRHIAVRSHQHAFPPQEACR